MSEGSVKKQLISGAVYTGIAKYAGIVVSLVITGVLSRLLTPDDFGIVAIATVIIAFFSIFSDLGIAPAIIQHKELDKQDLNNIFSFTIWSGIIISLLFFASSWLIAGYYDSPILLNICKILSLNLLFATFNIVPNALIYKAKRFRFIAIRTLSVQVVCGTIAIIAALRGAGLYALLINPILSSLFLFLINLRQYPQKLRLSLGTRSLRKIFSFSMYQFFFNIINYFTRNLDKLLIGKFMGMNPLGYYEKSYRVMMLPLQNITHVISPVMHPIFSDFQHDFNKLSSSYVKVFRFLAFIGLPLSVFLCFTAKEIILILFGPQWVESISVFRILALSVGVQIVLSTSGSIFQAANSTRIMFISGLISSVINVAGILLGIFVFGTLEAVAWCICVTFTMNFFLCYILMYRVTFKISSRPFWQQFVSPLILCALSTAVMYGLGLALPEMALVPSLIIKGVVFTAVFVLYIQLSGEYDIISEVRSILKKGQKK